MAKCFTSVSRQCEYIPSEGVEVYLAGMGRAYTGTLKGSLAVGEAVLKAASGR